MGYEHRVHTLKAIAITVPQHGYPAFMTLDLGAIALGAMRVEGWGQHVGYDKPVDVWRKELNIEPIRHGQNSWYEVLAHLEL